VSGKLNPIMKKSAKIVETVVRVLTQKRCECGEDNDKYFEGMLCLQRELEDEISKTITTDC
jgi:hypothetical protein